MLDEVMTARIPRVSYTRWNFRSRVVNSVYENREALLKCFEKLEGDRSMETVQKARGLRLFLQDKEFNFWLTFFHQIMPHVDILFRQVQSRQVDSLKLKQEVQNFVKAIEIVRKQTHTILEEVDANESSVPTSALGKKRKCLDTSPFDAKEVCDMIITQIRDRFEFVEYFDVSKLVDSENFSQYSSKFPEKELDAAAAVYPLDKSTLKTELSVIYERLDFRKIVGALPLLNFIIENNIEDTFQEVTKLL